jgi:hypothetical protein
MAATNSDPLRLISTLRDVLDETERDFTSMPFFVRPMVRRGFASRTGRSLEEWQRLASELLSQVKSGDEPARVRARHPRLREELERLAENYRTAPERASRGMGGGALQAVTEASRRREESVRALLAWLG